MAGSEKPHRSEGLSRERQVRAGSDDRCGPPHARFAAPPQVGSEPFRLTTDCDTHMLQAFDGEMGRPTKVLKPRNIAEIVGQPRQRSGPYPCMDGMIGEPSVEMDERHRHRPSHRPQPQGRLSAVFGKPRLP